MYFHVLSCTFMYFHVLSCTFMRFHALSFTLRHFHALSWTFMHFHALSYTFIRCHQFSSTFIESQPFSSTFILFLTIFGTLFRHFLLHFLVTLFLNIILVHFFFTFVTLFCDTLLEHFLGHFFTLFGTPFLGHFFYILPDNLLWPLSVIFEAHCILHLIILPLTFNFILPFLIKSYTCLIFVIFRCAAFSFHLTFCRIYSASGYCQDYVLALISCVQFRLIPWSSAFLCTDNIAHCRDMS